MKRTLFILLLFVSYSTFSQSLTLGLRAYYPFSGNANDASGNNNNPTFNNATLTADRLGNANSAYHFNGTNTFMQIPNSASLNTTNTLSLCAWVRPTGFYMGPCHGNSILMKGDADHLPGNYLLRFDDGAYLNYTNCANPIDVNHQNFYGGTASAAPPGYTPYIQLNEWYSIVLTNDGTTSSLYINCELKASIPQSVSTFTNSYNLFFGRLNHPQYPYWLNGDLDEVRIYDRALSQDEVNLYSAGDFVLNANPSDVTVCAGTPVQLEATGAAIAYSWDPPAGLSDASIYNPIATVITDATYIVTGTLGFCKKKDTIAIHVYPSPSANAGPDKSIAAGQQVMLDGSGSSGVSILWTAASTLTGANSFTPIASPTVTTNYTLTVTDNNNCIATDDVKVIVKDSVCTNPPNPVHAFTPNGDGINDRWLANTDNSCAVQVSVAVFNRYGGRVYKNDNYHNDWQGTYKGEPLPDATYYFVSYYKLSNGRTVVKKGDVTILR